MLSKNTTDRRGRCIQHGDARRGRQTPEYRAWLSIRFRCLNPNGPRYQDYGGRGITICDAWKNDFPAFLAAVGRKPSPLHSIDRINNDLGYEPGNVRWATGSEQSTNRRGTRWVTLQGETHCVTEWSQRYNVPSCIVFNRLKMGWDIERALSTPPRPRRRFPRH